LPPRKIESELLNLNSQSALAALVEVGLNSGRASNRRFDLRLFRTGAGSHPRLDARPHNELLRMTRRSLAWDQRGGPLFHWWRRGSPSLAVRWPAGAEAVGDNASLQDESLLVDLMRDVKQHFGQLDGRVVVVDGDVDGDRARHQIAAPVRKWITGASNRGAACTCGHRGAF
jgi:hypothetical protein